MPNQINASDIAVKKIDILSATSRFSLIPSLVELIIYEDIFEPALKGNITFMDSHNLPYKLPMVGEETIDIDISLSGFDDDSLSIQPPLFHVNSIRDREVVKPKAQLITLELVSEQYMSSIHSKVSNTISGTILIM